MTEIVLKMTSVKTGTPVDVPAGSICAIVMSEKLPGMTKVQLKNTSTYVVVKESREWIQGMLERHGDFKYVGSRDDA